MKPKHNRSSHSAMALLLLAMVLASFLGTRATAVSANGPNAVETSMANSSPKLRVLLLTGLNHHNWRETTPEIATALRDSGRFTVVEVNPPSPAEATASDTFRLELEHTDVIVNNWTDFPVKLEPDQPGVFPWMDQVFAFVRDGGGYVGVHAASFERHPEFLRLAGLHWRDPSAGARITVDEAGQIVRTPRGEGPGSGHGPLFVWPVTTRKPDHPVMTGLRAELPHARDELWHGVRGPAEEMELLATAWSPVTQAHEPMLWTVRYGKGRVFMTLLGHDAEAMRDLTFRFTLARGAEWAATGKTTLPVPAGLASATATQTIEVSGYQRELSGSSLAYHSPLPDVNAALLARARGDFAPIEWETAPLPTGATGDWVQFTWLFGLSVHPAQHGFRLYLNDRELLMFRNAPVKDWKEWTIEGDHGSQLSFRSTLIDQHGNLMGFASLRVPRSLVGDATSARLRVKGEPAESNAWYMTFKAAVADKVILRQQPVVLQQAGQRYFQVLLEITSLKDAGEARLQLEGIPDETFMVKAGANPRPLKIPLARGPGDYVARLRIGDQPEQTVPFTIRSVPEWTVYLVQHTHTDIGYTRPQTEILPEHLRFIDYALDYCDRTDSYPDDARFRWTCESSWAVREYLESRPPEQIARLQRRVAEGRIEVAGLFFNMSEIASESGLVHLLQPLGLLREHGLEVRTAMQNDVNGIGWGLAEHFPDLGIKYLIMGEHGHRAIIPFDHPTAFWWESASGKRTLTFRAEHYMYGNFLGLHQGELASFAPKLLTYLEKLAAKGYPLRRTALQNSGYFTDNSPPSTVMCDLVRDWNEHYTWPRLRIATAAEFMEYVEREHADELPVHRVAWPDWWTDGFGSAARETAASRTTASALNTQEGLLTMARVLGATLPPGLVEELREIKDALLFYDEHTFGAAESISDPMAENTMVQWAQKSSYVWEALKRAGRLNEVSMGFLQPYLPVAETPVITVFNTLNWPRSGVVEVYIDHELLPADHAFHIEDAQGARLPVQRLRSRADGTYWGLQVTDVPDVGYASYRVIRGNAVAESAGKTDFPGTLENRFYRIAFNADGQITSLHDQELNLELLESEPEWKAGQLIYERLSNRAQLEHFKLDHADRTSTAKMSVVEYAEGPVWNSLRLRGDLPGCADARGVEVEIRLHHAVKRVEWLYQMHKLPVTEPEGLYVAFPFGLEAGRLLFEAQGALIEPGAGQLEGTASDWNTVQSVVLARNDRAAIHWCSPEIPLVQLGDINLGQFRYQAKVEKPRLYSWVLNNYWTTNFRASQEGALHWTYTLSSTTDRSLTAATRFGWDSRIPLAARVLPPGAPRGALGSKSALRLEAPNLLLVNSVPAVDGNGVILQVRELEGRASELPTDTLVPGRSATITVVNALGHPLAAPSVVVNFKPYETRFLKLSL